MAQLTSRLHYALVTTTSAMQIFVLSSSRIQQRGYDTLFNYTTANPKSGVSKFVKQFPPKAQASSLGIAHGTATKLHSLAVYCTHLLWSLAGLYHPARIFNVLW